MRKKQGKEIDNFLIYQSQYPFLLAILLVFDWAFSDPFSLVINFYHWLPLLL
jgi:hypothetical protein